MRYRLLILLAASLFAATELLAQKIGNPDVRFQIAQDEQGLKINVDGKLFAGYVIDKSNKPFLWPVIGPTGKAMTRHYPMPGSEGTTGEQRDHIHHRGIFFGHESIGIQGWKFPQSKNDWNAVTDENRNLVGGDSWHEIATFRGNDQKSQNDKRLATLARIVHKKFTKLKTTDEYALVVQVCDYLDRNEKKFLTEERQMVFRVAEDARVIDFEQRFFSDQAVVQFDDRKDAGLSVRVPSSMAVDSKQGGQVVNSNGLKNGDAWSKRAKWCDYYGPVDGEQLGIAFLNHPSSFRFPTRWHVRGYGLFTANPFGNRSFGRNNQNLGFELKLGEKLTLKHRIVLHLGDTESAGVEQMWQRYANE